MWSATEEKSNPLSSREDVTRAVNTLLRALDKQFPAGQAQFSLGDTCARITAWILPAWKGFPERCGGYFR